MHVTLNTVNGGVCAWTWGSRGVNPTYNGQTRFGERRQPKEDFPLCERNPRVVIPHAVSCQLGTQDCCIGQGGIHLSTYERMPLCHSWNWPSEVRISGILLQALGAINFGFSVAHTIHHQPMWTPKGRSKFSSKSLVRFINLLKKSRVFNGGSNHTDGIFVKFVLFTINSRDHNINVYDGWGWA